MVNFGEVWRAQLAKFTLLTSTLVSPGFFSDLLMSVQMLKREWGAECNGKLPLLFIPSKTSNLVPEFAVEDLPLGKTAALVPEFALKDLPLSRTLYIYTLHIHYFIIHPIFKSPVIISLIYCIKTTGTTFICMSH